MKNLQFRTATLEDLPVLYQFEQGIITAERPFDPTLKPDPINYYDLKELVLSGKAEVIVAIIDNDIVASGYAKILQGEPFHKHNDYAYLGFMFVKPEHRGKGIIQGIVDELKLWTKANHLSEIRLEVYDDNDAAIRAYEKSNFKKHMIEMRMLIE
ncbi:GNAT family N-acetyltransferase [Winogradskyella immobilis]|uniref:GNAT family N-acetyltransferase n=1 Tax=Winogradskyella immobilis TaxID=2816852 RepID=A0ABS8ELI4_9FLAO|nr:GNAT family N-acetyltransferase [Winogradskyella immobilis]MCC1484066.1 GNAT family N-acetyltransferase [Winogradskyella immobilis]MCG0016158.1 GNAT family N-acetyltransferase [Winogradskyella immobilis]